MPSFRHASLVAVLVAAGMAPVRVGAAMAEKARWPPPGGTLLEPDSVNVEMTMGVADLDRDGLPEVVAISFVDVDGDNGGRDGVLRILRGSDLSEIASTADVGCVSCFGDPACRSLDQRGGRGFLCPACGVAIADLDRDGLMEIVAVAEGDDLQPDRRFVVFDHLGRFVRCSAVAPWVVGELGAPALADLDHDGTSEVVLRSTVFDGSGAVRWSAAFNAGLGPGVVADLDGDGSPEVISGEAAFHADGSVMWWRPDLAPAFAAVADMDLDCRPEVVLAARGRAEVHVLDGRSGATVASAGLPGGLVDCVFGQGGSPALADVDGDCVPEITVAGCDTLSLLRFTPASAGRPASLAGAWASPTDDISSRETGSTLFDLEGDGRFEVLYNDQDFLRIYDALTGVVLDQLHDSDATLIENPVVADCDADGHADVIVGANHYNSCCEFGVRVISDQSRPWAPARATWNEHAYHVTNILDDGTVPRVEEDSWRRFDAYRVQAAPTRGAAPTLHGVPPDSDAECGFVPPPPVVTATADCLQRPVVTFAEAQDPGPCGNPVLRRTWTAIDGCGRSASSTQRVTVRDTVAPVLDAAPADATVECSAVPPAAVLTARDTCDPAPAVTLVETRADGACADAYVLTRTWTARDRCGNVATRTQRVMVRDTVAPALDPAPVDATVECSVVPPPVTLAARDTCDPAPAVTFSETRANGSCADAYVLTRTWAARDRCGNAATRTQRVTVRDSVAPALDAAPGDVTVECGQPVPPAPALTVRDACDPAPRVTLVETRAEGRCAGEYQITRTWTATDRCGNVAVRRQVVSVVDTTPPVVTGVQSLCLWPPNHWMVCLGANELRPMITDACGGPVTWRIVGCASDQPENDVGDGDFAPDCVISADGQTACVRAERQGTEPGGRHYGIAIVAMDACGNATAPTTMASIYVPHDMSPHEDCLKTNIVGERWEHRGHD